MYRLIESKNLIDGERLKNEIREKWIDWEIERDQR